MSISIGSDSLFALNQNTIQTNNTSKLEDDLKSNLDEATDKELLEACQSFESYLVEQVFKNMEKTIPKDEENKENDYVSSFKDLMYEEYAKDATQTQGIGIAQMLYDSMKRNQTTVTE